MSIPLFPVPLVLFVPVGSGQQGLQQQGLSEIFLLLIRVVSDRRADVVHDFVLKKGCENDRSALKMLTFRR